MRDGRVVFRKIQPRVSIQAFEGAATNRGVWDGRSGSERHNPFVEQSILLVGRAGAAETRPGVQWPVSALGRTTSGAGMPSVENERVQNRA